MKSLTYNTNNGSKLALIQGEHDGSVFTHKEDSKGDVQTIPDNTAFISAGDMVMLINYYQYIKQNNIQCDFINPNGTNTR